MSISAVVPVRDGRDHLAESLSPLLDRVGKGLLEVIVVDDGSQDGSGELARELGAHVLRNEDAQGPAAARNRGAEVARGEVLFFVDADVVVHRDALDQVVKAFGDESVTAVFGSYDDRPRHAGFASRYMNLRHHHVHQQNAGEVASFWAGCGAVRTAAFRAAGGFDAHRYPFPSIEDIALGNELHAAGGRILLLPGLQGTHLKRWTLWGVIHTDVVRRALPWGRLIAAEGAPRAQLNASARERACAVVAWGIAVTAALAFAGALSPGVPLAALVVAGFMNRELLALWSRVGGLWFAIRALLQHQLYYLYGAAVFAFCLAKARLRGG